MTINIPTSVKYGRITRFFHALKLLGLINRDEYDKIDRYLYVRHILSHYNVGKG